MAGTIKRFPSNAPPLKNRTYTWETEKEEMKTRNSAKPNLKNIEFMSKILRFGFNVALAGITNPHMNSPHSTGRALDLVYKNSQGYTVNFEETNWNLINFLYMYRYDLEVEEIHDYVGLYIPGTMTDYTKGRGSSAGWGCAYRCNRDVNAQVNYPNLLTVNPPGWIKFTKESSPKDRREKHIHIEFAPKLANYTEKALVDKVWPRIESYHKYDWKYISFVGRNENCYVKTYLRSDLKLPVTPT